MVNKALKAEDDDLVASAGGNIKGRDMHTLRPRQWLNDLVIFTSTLALITLITCDFIQLECFCTHRLLEGI